MTQGIRILLNDVLVSISGNLINMGRKGNHRIHVEDKTMRELKEDKFTREDIWHILVVVIIIIIATVLVIVL